MWPWAHLAVGYLVYSLVVRVREQGTPSAVPALALAAGTQGPDLVDKPLGWYLGVLPSGRSLAHSLFAVGLVVGLAVTITRARGRGPGWVAFAFGYAAHVAADALYPLTTGQFGDVAFLAWPLVPLPEGEEPPGLLALLRETTLTPFLALELVVTVVGIAVWVRHGRPGIGVVRGWLRRRLPTRLA